MSASAGKKLKPIALPAFRQWLKRHFEECDSEAKRLACKGDYGYAQRVAGMADAYAYVIKNLDGFVP